MCNIKALKFLFLYIILFVTPIKTQANAPDFAFPITVSDGMFSQALTLGLDPNGTDGYDSNLDVYSPPLPPAGGFGTLLEWQNEQYYTDIRKYSTAQIMYIMKYQPATGGAIVLRWNRNDPDKLDSCKIIDNINGVLFSLNMKTTDSLRISSSPYITNSLKILFVPKKPIAITTDPSLYNKAPAGYLLLGNYPNPFNAGTVINYRLPEMRHVTLCIYNQIG